MHWDKMGAFFAIQITSGRYIHLDIRDCCPKRGYQRPRHIDCGKEKPVRNIGCESLRRAIINDASLRAPPDDFSKPLSEFLNH